MNPVASSPLDFLPHGLPPMNVLLVFGVLLAFGTLGGLLAARVRWLPTITGFMALGLAVGPSGAGLLSREALDSAKVLVDIALGLILFQLGATLHPWKALRNRALLVTSLVEGGATFAIILGLMIWIGAPPVVAVLAAAIAVSSSPAVLMHVAHELHAEGPTVDAAEALVAMNNVFAFLLFSLALPFALHDAEVPMRTALLLPAYQAVGAIVVSVAVAWVVTRVGLLTRTDEQHLRFALVVGAVMLSLGLAQALKVSSLFASLTLGIACRWLQGRSRLTRVEFGGGADLFFIILFVFAGANLHIHEVIQYAPVALAFVVARSLAKTASVYGCGRVFEHPHRQSVAVGLLLLPMAGLAIGLVQTTGWLVPELADQVSAIVLAAVALFETIGPPIAAYALRLSGDAGRAAVQAGETDALAQRRIGDPG
ncbi:MAG TPA: cation:proton antiporter [Burkholderiaceae bacterium]|jgi:Kef-type K+ transport system membrane component KefB|nr:cation:proton antiporter [Burkholderiaceae bacterium]